MTLNMSLKLVSHYVRLLVASHSGRLMSHYVRLMVASRNGRLMSHYVRLMVAFTSVSKTIVIQNLSTDS